jgi:TniQ
VIPSRLFYGFDPERVADPQSIIPGESLLGWIARTTVENELPNITTILRDVGQGHRNRFADVMSGPIDIEGLSVILGSDRPVVESLRAEDLGDDRSRYLGSIVSAGDVHTRERRFAPASLAADDVPYYRASWLLRTFPVCTTSWQILRSDCTCGAAQTWATISSYTLCESCGEDLRDLPGKTVPEDQRPGLQFFADLLFDDNDAGERAKSKLPPELRTLNGGEIFELALVTARIVDPTLGNPRENVWRDEPARLAQALSVVPDLLFAWPKTPWRALEAVGDIRKMQPRSDALKALQWVLSGVYRPRLPASLGEQFDRMRDAITLDGTTPHEHLVDLNEAEKMLGATKRTIRTARASGHFECLFALHRGEAVTAFSRAELEAIAATRDWPAAGTLTKPLGLPPYGIEQLCAMNELGWAKAPHRTLDLSLKVDPLSVKQFEDALMAGAIPVSAILQPVSLTAAMRGVGGREKAWGPVLRRLIDGVWSYAVTPDGSCVRSIIVEQEDVEAIRSVEFCMSDWPSFPFDIMLNQTDACDILNVPLRDRGSIERHKIGAQRGSRLYPRSKLSLLAKEIITSSELCARHLLRPKTAAAVLRRAGLTPSEFGYVRGGAAAKFELELSTRSNHER